MDYHVIIEVSSIILLFIVSIIKGGGLHGASSAVPELMLNVTPRYTSLSGDLDVTYNLTRLVTARMPVDGAWNTVALLMCDDHVEALTTLELDLSLSAPAGKFAFKCGSLVYGGVCWVKLIIKVNANVTEIITSDHIDIRWPLFKISTPTLLETFTSDVTVSLEATGIACPPVAYSHRTWLELAYVRYNESALTSAQSSPNNRRVITEVNDFFKIISREFTVACTSFDQAGVYQIRLKTNSKRPQVIASSALITVRWSERYRVAFQTGSTLFPCSLKSEMTIFYQHPKCILFGDKIRVYGRVSFSPNAPAASPFVYNYISEKRVELNKNSVTFPCDVFAGRRYVEYCAKYVSMAQHGAVAEVRSTCISTQGNVALAVDGRWSSWSPWSICTGSCSSGTKTRHRVCDSPSPKNGGKFCQGHPVESQNCSLGKCPDRANVRSPVDTFHMSENCRCGCQLNLTTSAVYVASSGFYCPLAAASWTFQVGRNYVLRFTFLHFNLNDTFECLQIRNGKLPSSELLLHETGHNLPRPVVTSLPVALLRYHTSSNLKSGNATRLGLGFVVRVEPMVASVVEAPDVSLDSLTDETLMVFSPLHLAALVFCILLVCFTIVLIAQHFCNVIYKRPSDSSHQSPLTSSPGSFRGGTYPNFHPVTSTTSISEMSVKHEPIQRRTKHRHYQHKKCPNKSASLDSIISSQGCKSPEDYLRDSKLFQTSTSSLDSQHSTNRNEVSQSPSPSKHVQNQAVLHPRQQVLIPPLTPGMTRKLPVATVSPQPARVVSPSFTNKSSEKVGKCKHRMDRRSVASSEEALDKQSNYSEHSEYNAKTVNMPHRRKTDNNEKKKLKTAAKNDGSVTSPCGEEMVEVRMRRREDRRQQVPPSGSRQMMASLSEFSLMENDEDNFEYDYYDYGMNMQPGSYLSGQYPSWLPPFLPVQPSPYNMEVPMQHFRLSNTLSSSDSRPISDASNYQESSADELVVSTPLGPAGQSNALMGVYSQLQSPTEKVIEKSSHIDNFKKI